MQLTKRITTRLSVLGISLLLASACSTTQKTTQSSRAAIEQLLQSEAVSRSLTRQEYSFVPIPDGAKVTLKTTGLSKDSAFVGEVVGNWLGKQGYILESPQDAQYRINIVVNSLGTEYGEVFFGMPQISGTLLPISIPELSIYKSQSQIGYANFSLNIYELPSGRFMHATPSYLTETFYNNYTVLLLFTFNKTDLDSAPDLRSLKRIIE
ncbi:hypothetical protein SAMN05421690_10206 [Nitrosomonas sp. Nm51]|uniref:hypothetical protein n=1 Tax=Nitrosomonas sp. Nm51 TaxID=133720 RepID=UPI0008D7ADE0|nr:hypothetical protein [Nitrosomonas sp. Nm51]SER33841.1 hypothetical protein SAMN05421690_10206 [Nitrosomonas sp. Nm51]